MKEWDGATELCISDCLLGGDNCHMGQNLGGLGEQDNDERFLRLLFEIVPSLQSLTFHKCS